MCAIEVKHAHGTTAIADRLRVPQAVGYDEAWTNKVLEMKMRTQPDTWVDGKFVHPHDACFDKDLNIIVAEWVDAGRVSFLRRV